MNNGSDSTPLDKQLIRMYTGFSAYSGICCSANTECRQPGATPYSGETRLLNVVCMLLDIVCGK